MTIPVKLKENPYNIYISRNSVKAIPSFIKKTNLGNFGIIITSKKILNLHKKIIKRTFNNKSYKIVTVADGEKAKSKKWLFSVIEELIKADGLNKKLFIICLGGGTIGDLGGFAASIYKRGIPLIQVPTTLLAQIDSSIGGKTAIDLACAKNILGTFYQPKAVFIDPCFLKTLPLNALKQGLAEAIKYGIIKDREFFYFLKSNHKKILKQDPYCMLKLISTCSNIKAKIVAQDEKEKKGLRTILNFGHTFAHALESASQYNKISHGQAVAIGMQYAAILSFLLKKCGKTAVEEVFEIIKIFSLPVKVKFNQAALCKSLYYDKKFISGKIRMVILKKIGRVQVVEGISLQNIKKTLSSKLR